MQNTSFSKLIVLFSVSVTVSSLLLAFVIILAGGGDSQTLTYAHFIVAGLATTIAILSVRRKSLRPTKAQFVLVIVLAVAGLFLGLLFHDDLLMGQTILSIRWGFPYGWLRSNLNLNRYTIPKDISFSGYVIQHPAQAIWGIVLAELVLDILFWTNLGIIIVAIGTIGTRLRRPASEIERPKSNL